MKEATPVAIILAGGLGTRLRSVIADLPKPMAPVNGKPFLHYIFQYLTKQGITQVVLAVGYKYEPIRDFFGSEYIGIKIQYSVEQEPLGTGGGIKKAFNSVQDEAYVLNGDTFFDVDLAALRQFYYQSSSEMAVSLKPMKNFDRYGSVQVDSRNRITEFCEKKFMPEGLINGGVYFFRKELFQQIQTEEKFSFEKKVLERYASSLTFSGKIFDNYFIDIGIPEDYERAQHEFK